MNIVMMIPQVDRLTKGRKIVLCTIIAVFAAFLVAGTTWSRGGGGGGDDGGGGGRVHTSTTGQCAACHGTSLTAIHQESWSTSRTGCYICHPTGRRDLYDYLAGASFNCLSCHALSGTPVDYHMNMDTKHISVETEAVCMVCHGTGIIPEIPSASLPEVHQGLDVTIGCPSAVAEIEDDIYCYCLECHANPGRIPTLPDNANCTSCHEAESYSPPANVCPHDGVTSHEMCTDCHIPCP